MKISFKTLNELEGDNITVMSTNLNEHGDEIAPVIESHRELNQTKPSPEKWAELLVGHGNEQVPFTYEEEKAVVKKIDRRVLTLLLGAYFFQQLDKSSLRCV